MKKCNLEDTFEFIEKLFCIIAIVIFISWCFYLLYLIVPDLILNK